MRNLTQTWWREEDGGGMSSPTVSEEINMFKDI